MAEKDYYLKIDGIKGESKKLGHLGEIEMDNWGFGETQSGTAAMGSGSAAGRVSMQDFHFSKPVDSSTPLLFQHCANGKLIKEAVFTTQRTGESGGKPIEYLKVIFGDVIISSHNVSGGGDGLPMESISFNFANVRWEYKEVIKGVAQGAIKGGYDVKLAKKI